MLSRRTLLLMAFICAATVGNLYYAQPLLAELGRAFGASPGAVGWVVTLAQIGYGLGVLLIVPLGDALERRSMIVALLLAVTVSLCVAGSATSLPVLVAASLAIGFTTVVPQIIVPYTAAMARPEERAGAIGLVQSGLLIGILLARTVSGTIAAATGWRSVFFGAAGLSLFMVVLVARTLPRQASSAGLSYGALLRSMLKLALEEPRLRRAAWASACNFAAFSAFWTTLAFLLDASFHYGPAQVGLFGVVGVAGALSAPLAGRLSDRRGTTYARVVALVVTLASFLAFGFAEHSLVLLVVGVVVLDAGVQAVHIACQAEALSLGEAARSRLNGVYMFLRFAGGAVGSMLGSWAWTYGRWPAVCGVGVAVCVAAFAPDLLQRLAPARSAA